VWNYIQGLLLALATAGSSDTFVAFVSRESEGLVPAHGHFERVRVDIRSSVRAWRVAYENTAFYALARRHRLDCLHWFSGTQGLLSPAPSVVTIYDLQPYLRLSPYSWNKRFYLKLMTGQTVRRARVLLPMSEATAAGLTRILGTDPGRMEVIPPVVGDEFRPAGPGEDAGFRARHRLPGRFWLYVAHFYPHKNHLRLLEAYAALRGEGLSWPLVFRGDDRGAEGEVRKRVRELGLDKDVVFLERLEREELRLLYSAATALVFPSLYEGGGIPVVEAMACGLPVAASRIPPILEFAGTAALGFNPVDVPSIAAAMRELAGSAGLREARRRQGLDRAAGFRAETVIPRLLDAYARAASLRRRS
jgi:glycosyltransferase involved in cell wall biosynthesis